MEIKRTVSTVTRRSNLSKKLQSRSELLFAITQSAISPAISPNLYVKPICYINFHVLSSLYKLTYNCLTVFQIFRNVGKQAANGVQGKAGR